MSKITLREDNIVNNGFIINGKNYTCCSTEYIRDVCHYLMDKNFTREDWILLLQEICKNYGKYKVLYQDNVYGNIGEFTLKYK